MSRSIATYLKRFKVAPPIVKASPRANLGLVVVIPCYDEPNLSGTLGALTQCERPHHSVEVIIVVNDGESDSAQCRQRNEATHAFVKAWAEKHNSSGFALHAIRLTGVANRKAGVGFARKVGMDEAVQRLASTKVGERGVIACFDADSECDPNYLKALEGFLESESSDAASIYFEHPLDGNNTEAIIAYELHLRYFVEACRWAGHPYAFHTVGSSMAVRANAYARQGGMNTRKAGEDFYFMQKLIPQGRFGEINGTRTIPSARCSSRVPFGTGRAMLNYSGCLSTYPMASFGELRTFFKGVTELWQRDRFAGHELGLLSEFLSLNQFESVLGELRENTNSEMTFVRRFYRWFNTFVVMKFLHFARSQGREDTPVNEAIVQLGKKSGFGSLEGSMREWLWVLRARQRRGWEAPQ